MFFSDGPAETPVTNGSAVSGPALNDDLDIFGPMISNPLPATVMPPAQVCVSVCFYRIAVYFLFWKVYSLSCFRFESLLIFRPGAGKLSLQLVFADSMLGAQPLLSLTNGLWLLSTAEAS